MSHSFENFIIWHFLVKYVHKALKTKFWSDTSQNLTEHRCLGVHCFLFHFKIVQTILTMLKDCFIVSVWTPLYVDTFSPFLKKKKKTKCRYSVSRPVETHMSGTSKNSAQHTKVKTDNFNNAQNDYKCKAYNFTFKFNTPLCVNRSALLQTLWPKRNWTCWPG